jgi:hypothetical protein
MSAAMLRLQLATRLRRPGAAPPAGLRAPVDGDLAQRWSVHRNTFVSSLVEAHSAGFPVTAALIGADCFHTMARARVLAEPPRQPVVVEYLQDFPEFVAAWPATASLAYLADVARIEAWRLHAHHAADASALASADYQQLRAAPERLARWRPRLQPAARWLRSRQGAFSLWQAHQGVADLAAVNLMYVDTDSPEDVLVTRSGFDVRVVRLPAGGIGLLQALHGGDTLGDAFAQALADDPHADVARLFCLLVDHDLLVHPLPAR